MPGVEFFGPGPGGSSAPAEIFGPGPGGAMAPAIISGPGPSGAMAPGKFLALAPGPGCGLWLRPRRGHLPGYNYAPGNFSNLLQKAVIIFSI